LRLYIYKLNWQRSDLCHMSSTANRTQIPCCRFQVRLCNVLLDDLW
jgi:hypothetical protein